MPDTPVHVVVPYADFLERRERRHRVTADLQRRDGQPTPQTELVSVAVANRVRVEPPVRSTTDIDKKGQTT